MPIYHKYLASPGLRSPTTWTDIPGLSPIEIQGGESLYAFQATLNISGLTIPTLPSEWQVAFRILHGTKTLAIFYMGSGNAPFSPNVCLTGADMVGPDLQDPVQAQWSSYNVQAIMKEASSFSIIWDESAG